MRQNLFVISGGSRTATGVKKSGREASRGLRADLSNTDPSTTAQGCQSASAGARRGSSTSLVSIASVGVTNTAFVISSASRAASGAEKSGRAASLRLRLASAGMTCMLAFCLTVACRGAQAQSLHAPVIIHESAEDAVGDASGSQSVVNQSRGIAELTHAVMLSPRDASAYMARAHWYAEHGNTAAAITDVRKELMIEPRDFAAHAFLGSLYLKMGAYKNALFEYNRVLSAKAISAGICKGRGDAYFGLKKPQLAVQNYSLAIRLQPNDPAIYRARSEAYVRSNQLHNALLDMNMVCRLEPKRVDNFLRRGQICAMIGDRSTALQQFNMASAINPSDWRGLYKCAVMANNDMQFQRALKICTAAVRQNPNVSCIYGLMGTCYYNMQQYENALSSFDRAIALNPRTSPYYGDRADAYAKLGQGENAVRDYNRAIALAPKDRTLIARRDAAAHDQARSTASTANKISMQ